MLNPTLKIHYRGGNRFTVDFKDGETRCHIWAAGPGKFEDIVHRNAPAGQDWRGDQDWRHSASPITAKKYAKIRERLHALSPAAFKLARDAYEKSEREKAEAEEKRRRAADLQNLRALADRLGFDLVERNGADRGQA